MTPADSPYKFLDAYEEDEGALFFGRERESQILLSDIVISGLVLLFAETGTGKTSLMRAGVTPLLQERDYVTFFVRVSEDPAASLRDAVGRSAERLRGMGFRPSRGQLQIDDAAPLAPQLRVLAQSLERPIVVFFDQFEEFFLYVHGRDRTRAQRFIDDIATLHRDDASRVQVVLAMREDFVGKMDVFRDAIPAIFHRDSNLRLRPLDEDQARLAITGPAKAGGVEVDPELADALVADLLTPEGVDPTELQIVCDTLWNARGNGDISAAQYRDLARGTGGTSAQRVLGHRLEEEFEHLEESELDLLARLLPLLRTPADPRRVPTKYVRDVDGLATELGVARERLAALLGELIRMRVVREGLHPNLVELTHDYLVRQLDELARRVRTIAPRKALRRVAGEDGADALTRAELEQVLGHLDDLELSPGDIAVLLHSALEQGRFTQLAPVLARAQAAGIDPWGELEQMLAAGPPQALRAIEFLVSSLERGPASRLLEDALAGEERIAARAIEALETRRDSTQAVELLGRALERDALRDASQSALAGLARLGSPGVREVAGALLLDWNVGRAADARRAIAALERISAVEVIEHALRRSALAAIAEDALVRLAQSGDAGVAKRAGEALLDHLETQLGDRAHAARAVRRLAQLETTRVVDLLIRALTYEELAPAALARLRQLAASAQPAVAGRAREALEAAGDRAPAPAPAPPQAPRRSSGPGLEAPRGRGRIAHAFWNGEVVPFLGAGSGFIGRPTEQRWQRAAEYPPTLPELATYLAEKSRYPYSDRVPNFARVCEYIQLMHGTGALYDWLRAVFEPQFDTNALHRLLAGLAAQMRRDGRPLPLIVTTAYDDTLERAFRMEDEPLEVLSYVADGRDAGSFALVDRGGVESRHVDDVDGSGERVSLLVKLFGGINRADEVHDSYVATEAALADFLVTGGRPLPASVMARLRDSHLLFLGHSGREWWERVVIRRLLGNQLLYASWAIVKEPDELGRGFWDTLRIDALDVPLETFLDDLAIGVEEAM